MNSSGFRCPVCKQKATEPINMRCDHHPCYQCAISLLQIQNQCMRNDNKPENTKCLQVRYQIICPVSTCNKKTITYDLRHLIINNTQVEQDMYVTNKFIDKKAEITYCNQKSPFSQSTNYKNNIIQLQQNNFVNNLLGKSNNFHNIGHLKHSLHKGLNISETGQDMNVDKNIYNSKIRIICKKHQGYNLQYFCKQCLDKNQSEAFLCSQCTNNHQLKHHQQQKCHFMNINNQFDKIKQLNMSKKRFSLPQKSELIKQSVARFTKYKQSLQGLFQNLYRQVGEEFKAIYHYINDQYQLTKKQVKMTYTKHFEQIKHIAALAQKLKEGLQQLQKIPTQICTQIQSQVHYTMCLCQIQKAFQLNKFKLNAKYEAPKLAKRSEWNLQNSKIFQIQCFDFSIKEECPLLTSRPITPSRNSKFQNGSFNPQRNQKSQNPALNISYMKQNYGPHTPLISPKNYFSNQLGR